MKHLQELPAWRELWQHFDATKSDHMRELFATDPGRAERYWLEVGGLKVDYSKNRITDETLALLMKLAREAGLPERMKQMFRGEKINTTENRAALHVALRNRTNAPILVDGEDVMPQVNHVLHRMGEFAHEVRSGDWLGYTNQVITDVVNIGIGGSDLGPLMMCNALKPFGHPRLKMPFVSNIDGSQLRDVLEKVHPETTLFVVASKTFTTQETLTNALTAREWFLKHADDKSAVAKHFVAVSTNKKAVAEFGIDTANMFEFWDWVGGRYSVWSAIGLPLMVAIGEKHFREFLRGARAMDEHFFTTPYRRNIPVLLALIGIWYNNFYQAPGYAVVPYSHNLRRLPAYLQQLDMESNGKHCGIDGGSVALDTGPIVFGEEGVNCQHAFFQLLHQGTRLIPSDFIVPMRTAYKVGRQHRFVVANAFAQAEAFMRGKTLAEARAELADLPEAARDALAPQKVFPGNQPSNSILIDELTPFNLGMLLAMYEHKIFVQGTIWGINPFDQWGVEYGKVLAKAIEPELNRDQTLHHDSSTNGLIDFYRACQQR